MTAVRTTARDGRWAIRSVAGAFEVNRLFFPGGYRQAPFTPDRGYLVVVLDGAVCKSFTGDSATLSRDTLSALPAGASHSSTFAGPGTQVLVVRSTDDASAELASLLVRRRHEHVAASTALGWRMVEELGRRDACSALALEGLVLQLLATASRAADGGPRRAPWVSRVREILHDECPAAPSLADLAALVGHRPSHVARAFRREYGVTPAQYARVVRLDWARELLAAGEAPIREVAIAAGFVDQSHFTRAFRAHTGVTPGRYRAVARANSG